MKEINCDVTLQRLVTVPLRTFLVVNGDGAPTALTITNGVGSGTYNANSRIDIFANPPAAGVANPLRPARYFIEELMHGEVVCTSAGEHFETVKLYERHRRHGSMDISNLIEMPEDLLDSISGGV